MTTLAMEAPILIARLLMMLLLGLGIGQKTISQQITI